MSRFYKLRILEKREEIKDACSIVLEKPAGFDYHAGQHLPIRFFLNGKEVRRTYTLSSSPMDPHLQLTVKRVAGGLVSNHINEHVKVGDWIEARPPIGHIYVACHPVSYRTYYLFAAGSGITPMMSIARTVLAQEPYSHVRLFYGNKSEDTIIFRSKLDELAKHSGGRLVITHSLTAPKRDTWSALWRTDLISDARKGYIDGDAVNWFIDNHRPVSQDCDYFVCGPGNMNSTIRDALLSLKVPAEDIHIEYFKAPEKARPDVGRVTLANDTGVVDAQASVTLDGKQFSVAVPKGQTLLQAVIVAGHQPPYSCEAGICATCRARLSKGSVHMPSAPALEKKEIAQGVILTCQAYPKVGQVVLTYD